MVAFGKGSIFTLMTARMKMLGVRQKTLAQNVANVSTPRYMPGDVDTARFSKAMKASTATMERDGPRMTHMRHLGGGMPQISGVRIEEKPDSETTLDGNSVVVEEQMSRLARTRMEFETMIGLYRKSLSMLRLASRNPV